MPLRIEVVDEDEVVIRFVDRDLITSGLRVMGSAGRLRESTARFDIAGFDAGTIQSIDQEPGKDHYIVIVD